MTDLNSLLPLDSGWLLTTATAINRDGVVVGTGYENGYMHGYLLYTSSSGTTTPTPTPTPIPTYSPSPSPIPTPTSSQMTSTTPAPAPTPGPDAPKLATRVTTSLHPGPATLGAKVTITARISVVGENANHRSEW